MLIFSERLKKLRSKYDRTQGEIAHALDMTTQNYSAYERGREPPYDVLVKIAHYFSVSTDFLLGINEFDSYDIQMTEKEIVIDIEPYKKNINTLKLLPEIMRLPSFVDFLKSVYIYITASDKKFKDHRKTFTVSEELGIIADFTIVEKVREAVLSPFVIDLLNDMQKQRLSEYIRKETSKGSE